MASESRCGAWYQAGGCILPKRHDGQHRNQRQLDHDRLTDDLVYFKKEALAARSDRAALEASNREMRSLLECTQFALEWLILHHVIEDGGKDWKSKFDGSAFFACDCSENGGYMDYDVNAYEHTERCASGFEDSLGALLDQIKAALASVEQGETHE